MPDLTALGWTRSLADAFAPYARDGLVPGRVAVEYTHVYRVETEAGPVLAPVAGRLRHRAASRQDYPAVGDWVALQWKRGHERGVIQAVLPRRSRFLRKSAGHATGEQVVAANVDTVFLMAGLDRDYNPRRMERYLVLARESGAHPVILLNKADIGQDVEARRREMATLAPDVPVHVVSARTRHGLDALAPYLEFGRTVALLGSSGVGKSTLINELAGEAVLPTADVRRQDGRGRHTSIHRELIGLPGGAVLIDTPGMRELQLWDVEEGLERTFPDIEALAGGCRFRDCRHRSEPGCAVREAVTEKRLPSGRLESYHKLQDELRALEARRDERARLDEKRRTKIVHKACRRQTPRPKRS